MKIAIFTDTFSPQINGIVVHVNETAKLLQQRGHQILLFAPKHAKVLQHTIETDGLQICYLPSIPFFIYTDFRFTVPFSKSLVQVTRKFDPDILHFHTPLTIGASAVAIARMMKKPLVGTFHTYFMESEYLRIGGLHKVGLDKNKFIIKSLWSYGNLFYNRADVVISPSQFTKNDLIQNGITKPVEVITNGITLPNIVTNLIDIRTKYPDIPDKYFIYVGRLSREKSLHILIESFKKFADNTKDVHLILVGEGPIREELENLVNKLEIQSHVHFLGMIPHGELLKYNLIPNAIAFATASTSETQGISLLEGMSLGLPIIGVDSRGLKELVNENGILCKPDNVEDMASALKILVENKQLREAYSKQSKKLASLHSLSSTVDQMEHLYQSLVQNSYIGAV